MFARFRALVGLILFSMWVSSGLLQADETLRIEAFTVVDDPISGKDDHQLQGATVTVYAVDGIARFESALSRGLPPGAEAAKVEALRRLSGLDEARQASAKEAAMGLAKAMQYGVDRYPAIVFDGSAVVYGVTDLADAHRRYVAWHKAQPQ